MIPSPWSACYFFGVALVLAILEIQIEGPFGWAERLPTWRWDGPGVQKWLGKPVTAYHLCLNLLILIFLHFPVVGRGTSVRLELEIFSIYSLLCVSWDFLWFACNPSFGLRRFRPENVWWFRGWWLGVPRSYWGGVAASAASYILAGGVGGWEAKALSWGLILAQFVALTGVVVGVASFRLPPLTPLDPSPRQTSPRLH